MDAPFIGTVVMFGGNFAPRGWALCQGQLLSIAQNTALFSILGTTYGGNGQTTFGLPDLRSRVPVGQGQGPGLSPYTLGEQTGSESVTLISSQMPMHTHAVAVSGTPGTTPTATNNYLASADGLYGTDPVVVNAFGTTPNATLAPNSVAIAGGNQPHTNVQPVLCMNYIIALEGIFPPRS